MIQMVMLITNKNIVLTVGLITDKMDTMQLPYGEL